MKRSLLLIMLALCASVSLAWADARSDARTHYQAGQKAYAGSDYKVAIKEFSAAQDLAPADLNNYNLALCYDKLGDADNALTYYRQYLDKVPDAPKRSEIEASMARLDSAKKSKADKTAAADKKADADKKAQADADAKKAEDMAKVAPPVDDKKAPIVVGAPDVAPPPIGAGVGVGSTGTPSSGLTVTTGDSQLDHVQGINIDQIRDQRMGSMPQDRNAPPNGQQGQQGRQGQQQNPNGQPNGMAAMNGGNGQQNPSGQPLPADKSNQTASSDTPIYKKWWFWVVVAVGVYVTYEIATSNSNSDVTNARMFDKSKSNVGASAVPQGGYTLLRF
jgi:tetratricopeptide (TPR) repeat protein